MKDIKGYEGLYKIDEKGNVLSVKNNRILKPGSSPNGYMGVFLYKGRGKGRKRYNIHRLVAENFIPNPENKKEVNHIDGNKKNNCVENLVWCTRGENEKHAYKNNLKTKKGVNHHMAKFTEEDIIQIRKLRNQGLKQREIAEMYDVSREVIRDIVNNITWKHIKE